MAATATTSASATPGPRYAPEDPSLPKPWRGLVDGKTGYLYFWNPETNVTQYERPASSSHSHASSISSRPSSSYVSSSAQLQQSSNVPKDSDEDGSRGSNGNRSQQSTRCGNPPSEAVACTRENGPVDAGSILSPEAYRRRHEISVSGNSVPSPFTTFEATGFPSEILKEMRYFLQGGANVVRCVVLCLRALLLESSFALDHS